GRVGQAVGIETGVPLEEELEDLARRAFLVRRDELPGAHVAGEAIPRPKPRELVVPRRVVVAVPQDGIAVQIGIVSAHDPILGTAVAPPQPRRRRFARRRAATSTGSAARSGGRIRVLYGPAGHGMLLRIPDCPGCVCA